MQYVDGCLRQVLSAANTTFSHGDSRMSLFRAQILSDARLMLAALYGEVEAWIQLCQAAGN
jgi:hypothetical protein